MAISFGMEFAQLFLLIIGFALSLWVVKASAQLAYGQQVSWGQAFLQWLLLIILAFIASFIFSFLKLGYFASFLASKLFLR